MRLSRLRIAAVAVILAAYAPSVHAGSILDRIRSQGVIRCGGKERPGLVTVGSENHASGLFLDVCRAIGAGVLGPEGRVEFHEYDSSKAYDAVRDGRDDVYFLDASDVIEEKLADKILPGPPLFYMQTAVMVSEGSTAHHLADLAGQAICFSQGTNAHRNLEAWFAARHLDFTRMGYQEDVELLDTYNAQVCHGIAGEITTLAEQRLDRGANDVHSRILPEPLAVFPIMAATGTQDPEWASIVAWSIYSIVRAETPEAAWASGGLTSLPIEVPKLGLDAKWQERVVGAAGTYGDIYKRNLGDQSPYRLDRGLNAAWQNGGLFAVPYAE